MNDSDSLAHLFARLIDQLGEDMEQDGLVNTPQRAARAYRLAGSGNGPNPCPKRVRYRS